MTDIFNGTVGNRINFPDDVPYETAVAILGKPVADLLYLKPRPRMTHEQPTKLVVKAVDRENGVITIGEEE